MDSHAPSPARWSPLPQPQLQPRSPPSLTRATATISQLHCHPSDPLWGQRDLSKERVNHDLNFKKPHFKKHLNGSPLFLRGSQNSRHERKVPGKPCALDADRHRDRTSAPFRPGERWQRQCKEAQPEPRRVWSKKHAAVSLGTANALCHSVPYSATKSDVTNQALCPLSPLKTALFESHQPTLRRT